jgi:RNA polymerase sigma-70 factor (ECF subfamily)
MSPSTPVEVTWLLGAVAKGDADAFERLYAGTCAKVYGVVLRILRRSDLAAEVMEDAYLQIWRRAGEFDPTIQSPMAWMVAMARSRAIDLVRQSSAADGDGEDIADDDEGPGAVPRNAMTPDLRRLLTCIGRLEPDRQRMLLLAYYGAFTHEQLAAKLNMPVNLLRSSLRRCLAEIDVCLSL